MKRKVSSSKSRSIHTAYQNHFVQIVPIYIVCASATDSSCEVKRHQRFGYGEGALEFGFSFS